MYKPLADEIRPHSLDDVVGQKHILGERGLLRRIVESGSIPNMIFYGPSGTGKTTVARIIAEKTNRTLRKLNATTAGLADIKEIIAELDTLLSLAAVAAEHDVFGCKYVGLGWNAYKLAEGDTPDAFYDKYINVARVLKSCGKYFMYHNHDQEFQRYNGRLILEQMAQSFAPDEMGFTLDTFWVQAGGGDPAQWIEKLSGRVPCIHLKDYAYGRKMALIGEGNINFDRVFEKAESAGTEYMLVEQDDCNGENPLDCLKRSFEYLKSRGF